MGKGRAGSRAWWGVGVVALPALLVCAALAVGRPRLFPGHLVGGRSAFAHGDWALAAAEARARLKENPDDLEAVRLLARALARQGKDDSVQALFGRLGMERMQAEDLFLLASVLDRGGQSGPSLGLMESAVRADPEHTEAIYELARLYAGTRHFTKAVELAASLAKKPGWEVKGGVALGLLRRQLDDPSGAADALAGALRSDDALDGASLAPADARRLLARWRLESGQPAEAQAALEPLINHADDREALWLLSRAFLQKDDSKGSMAALARSHEYSPGDPTLPEPSPYAGSAKCAECHPAIYRAEQSSRHARTLYHANDLAALPLPEGPLKDPANANVSHVFHRESNGVSVETHADEKVFRAVVEYALGSGDRGLTMLGRDAGGTPRVVRMSLFADRSIWDLTPAGEPHPADPSDYVGRPLGADAFLFCIQCHMTGLRALSDRISPIAADHGIGCERCHGPAGNHLRAVALNMADPFIARPRLASAAQINRLCASCHNSDDPGITKDEPRFVRFHTSTLIESRCYTESLGGLSCLTCHDPHRNAETTVAHYESRCLVCHGTGDAAKPQDPDRWTGRATLPEGKRRVPCPVNPSADCIKCHMPTVKNVAPHTEFTDHEIRVHRP